MTTPLHFVFQLGGIDATRLALLEDVVRPVVYGLRRAGHRVTSFAQAFAPAPAVNIVIAHEGIELARRIAEGRAAVGAGTRVGLLCAEDVDGIADEPARWAILCDAVRAADFVWLTGDTQALDAVVPAHRRAVIEFGFDTLLLGRRLVPEVARRDAGLVVYGLKTAYRNAVAADLQAAGLSPFVVEPGRYPDYIAGDLLSRAVAVVACRDSASQRGPAAARMAKAICSAAVVIAEAPRTGPCPLAPYVTASTTAELVTACRAVLGDGHAVESGLRVLENFRAGTSMAAGLEPALAVPPLAARGGA